MRLNLLADWSPLLASYPFCIFSNIHCPGLWVKSSPRFLIFLQVP